MYIRLQLIYTAPLMLGLFMVASLARAESWSCVDKTDDDNPRTYVRMSSGNYMVSYTVPFPDDDGNIVPTVMTEEMKVLSDGFSVLALIPLTFGDYGSSLMVTLFKNETAFVSNYNFYDPGRIEDYEIGKRIPTKTEWGPCTIRQ